jgi:DNA repair protein RadC
MAAENSLRYTTMIRDIPRGERPRERLREHGPAYLSNAELIAILLRTGLMGENVLNLSVRLLSHFQGLSGLGRASFTELCALKGVSEAKACQILAALELGKRLVSLHPEDRAIIQRPEDVANLLVAEMGPLEQEHTQVLLLDSKNQVTGVSEIYIGNVNSSVVRAAEVFKPAIRDNAVAIIVVHNHPSGDPTPSPEDVTITEQLKESGELLGIELLDHIILAGQRHTSLKEQGLGF